MNEEYQSDLADLEGLQVLKTHTNTSEKLQIEATIEEWVNFMRTKNSKGVMSIYKEEAINFDMTAPLEYSGLDSIESRLTKWFSSFSSDLILDIEDLHIYAEGTVGFAHCLIRFMGEKIREESGGEDMYNRMTFGFEKIGNDWMISHQHTSLPFDMDSGMVLSNLKPAH